MKCIKCGGSTRKTESRRIFFDKIVVNPAIVEKCKKCGEEYMGEQEYERIRQKVEKIKAGIEPPTLKKIQFVVL